MMDDSVSYFVLSCICVSLPIRLCFHVLQFKVATCVCVCLLLRASKTHSSQSSVARDASLETENPRRLFLETTTE